MNQVADPTMNAAISAKEVEWETYRGVLLPLFSSKDRFSFENVFDGTTYVFVGLSGSSELLIPGISELLASWVIFILLRRAIRRCLPNQPIVSAGLR